MRTTDADRFAAYYAARYRALRRTAYLLCGDWHEAEDLTQAAFVRLYLAWGRVRALINDHGVNVREAAPSTPVQVLGLNEVADAGDQFDAAIQQHPVRCGVPRGKGDP